VASRHRGEKACLLREVHSLAGFSPALARFGGQSPDDLAQGRSVKERNEADGRGEVPRWMNFWTSGASPLPCAASATPQPPA